MKTLKIVIGFFTFVLMGTAPLVLAQDGDLAIKRSVDLRNGPGSYYELILRLNRGTIVKKQGMEEGWLQVSFEKYDGWMPDHPIYFGTEQPVSHPEDSSFAVKDRMNQLFNQFAASGDSGSFDSPYATPAQVAAAVKGFARKYEIRRGATKVDFSRSFEKRINIREYRRFRKSRIRDYQWSVAKERFPIQTDTIPAMTPAVEKMGWAIAGVIAGNGLVGNYELQEYLNYVALVVVESSHRYELPVQVHILDTNDVVGYGAPNGIIFVSRGALNLMETEAEFAFFVGHELAHVTLQHGVQETRDRKVKISAEKAFGELEEDMEYGERQDDKYVQVSQDLTAWTDQVYEYIISDKLEAYEHEADFWGMIYAYRAGYNPQAGLDLLKRFKQDVGDFETQIGELKWQGTDIDDRISRCQNTRAMLTAYPQLNDDFREEFQEVVGGRQ